MALGFKSSAKKGQHYDLAVFAINKLKSVNVLIKGKDERGFENSIVSYLESSPRLRSNIITQIKMDEVEKINPSHLFGFSHRPDISIGNDGTAIEIKVITSGQSVREILGQSIAYRMHYRFVVLFLIDQTDDRKVVEFCRNKKSQEFELLSELAATMNIFTVVGPVGASKNVIFVG